MDERRLTVPRLAEKAGVSAATVRALLAGDRWPNLETRNLVENALGWRLGELARRAIGSRAVDVVSDLNTVEIVELLGACCSELRKRLGTDVD